MRDLRRIFSNSNLTNAKDMAWLSLEAAFALTSVLAGFVFDVLNKDCLLLHFLLLVSVENSKFQETLFFKFCCYDD